MLCGSCTRTCSAGRDRERATNEFLIKVNDDDDDDACSSVHGRPAGQCVYVCGILSQPGLQARRTRDLHSLFMLHIAYM